MPARPLIIDCDPGVDDAVALLLAFAAPDLFEILGVTTVAGNVSSALTARNACVIRDIAGRDDVAVYAGADRPLLVDAVEAGHFHGESGLGDLAFASPRRGVETASAVQFICDTLSRAEPKSVSMAVTGPLTNIALALRSAPAIVNSIDQIVLMGGARSEGGNITASAEFNIYADPHAAEIVLGCGAPIVVLGLDATHQVRTTAARIAGLARTNNPSARAASQLFAFGEHVERTLAAREGAPLHDPCVIAYLMAPHLFETKPCRIAVETASPLTRGHTSVEFRITAPSKVQWAVKVDADGVFDLILRRLA